MTLETKESNSLSRNIDWRYRITNEGHYQITKPHCWKPSKCNKNSNLKCVSHAIRSIICDMRTMLTSLNATNKRKIDKVEIAKTNFL